MSQLTSGQRLATGTGATRRRLTEAEAQAGCLPELMTKGEWKRAFAGSLTQQMRAEQITADYKRLLLGVYDGRAGARSVVLRDPDLRPLRAWVAAGFPKDGP